jgi:hypothetical protein
MERPEDLYRRAAELVHRAAALASHTERVRLLREAQELGRRAALLQDPKSKP